MEKMEILIQSEAKCFISLFLLCFTFEINYITFSQRAFIFVFDFRCRRLFFHCSAVFLGQKTQELLEKYSILQDFNLILPGSPNPHKLSVLVGYKTSRQAKGAICRPLSLASNGRAVLPLLVSVPPRNPQIYCIFPLRTQITVQQQLNGANCTFSELKITGESRAATKMTQFSTSSTRRRPQATVIEQFRRFLRWTVPRQGPNRIQGQSATFSTITESELNWDSRNMGRSSLQSGAIERRGGLGRIVESEMGIPINFLG